MLILWYAPEALHITMFRVQTWQVSPGKTQTAECWQRLINLPINDVLCCVEVEKKLRTKCVEMHQVQSLTLTLSHTTGGEQQICKEKQIMLELSVQVNRWCNQLNKGQKETVNKELKRWLLIIFNRFNNKSAEAHLHSGIFYFHKPKSFLFPAAKRCRSQTQSELFYNLTSLSLMNHISEGGV